MPPRGDDLMDQGCTQRSNHYCSQPSNNAAGEPTQCDTKDDAERRDAVYVGGNEDDQGDDHARTASDPLALLIQESCVVRQATADHIVLFHFLLST